MLLAHSLWIETMVLARHRDNGVSRSLRPRRMRDIPRTPYTASDAASSEVLGIPDVRRYADAPAASFRAAARSTAVARTTAMPLTYLALSGGGGNGAYGAGILNGWTATGTRPEFTFVSGVSTGALIAPFAFLGPSYDVRLREVYISGLAESLLEISGPSECGLRLRAVREQAAARTDRPLRGRRHAGCRGRRARERPPLVYRHDKPGFTAGGDLGHGPDRIERLA